MHELAITEGILRIMEDQARQQNFSKVKTVWLEIGELSHLNREAISFCFRAVIKGSIAEGAKLEIAHVPGKAWCEQCDRIVELSKLGDSCPICGGFELQIKDGQEMRICKLEVV